MRILVTGITGYVGAALAPRLQRDGHDVVGLARRPERSALDVPVLQGDAVTRAGLEEAMDDVEVVYYLIHSMEPAVPGANGTFGERERRAAENVVAAARAAGVRRIVYLGGLVPDLGAASEHLASRLAVEQALLAGVPDSVALRASIVIGARSRSFRFLVRLIERLPVLALPGWRVNRTAPIDGRDVIEYLARAATEPAAAGLSLDLAGPDVVTYQALIERIRDAMLVGRPSLELGRLTMTAIESRVAAAVAGETHELIGPLMEGLHGDLLPRDDRAQEIFGVRRHRLDAAIERALRDWEATEPLRAR
ncbi:MAG: NAD-dependent epimerase/dehydratase family protein [Solirubrobacterales bacterium]|nr:NAD-dependent epimerase/dehydratase family protein [Solirubrobacterales bacterium]